MFTELLTFEMIYIYICNIPKMSYSTASVGCITV